MHATDVGIAILVLALAIQGLFRGLIAQVLGLAGWILGIWAGAGIRQWVGAHWLGAHPAVVFWTLRWLATLLAAMAVVTLLHVLGDRIGRSVQDSPFGVLDRIGGVVAGAVMGLAIASVFILAVVRSPSPGWMRENLRQSRLAPRLLEGGADVCRRLGGTPGSPALRRQFVIAARSLERRNSTI